jgi:serine/alanine adding enzyme
VRSLVVAADNKIWEAAMLEVGARDVYYLPQYHKLYQFGGGRPLAYIATAGEDIFFHPFLLRPIGSVGSIEVSPELNDVETVYGYTGPIGTTQSADFLREAWRGFDAWAARHGVVSEFIRFNPFLSTTRFAAPQTAINLDREMVDIRLDRSNNDLWNSYEPVQRNRVRKALKNRMQCREISLEDGLRVFRSLYEATMRRAGASSFYFFPCMYYDAIKSNLSAYSVLFFVLYEEKPIAAALFLTYGETMHYHLGGSSEEYLSLAPNNLMFHQVAVWAQQRGFTHIHLGGGRTNHPDDRLLRFKKRFSHDTVPLHLGRRVHNRAKYDGLCDRWLSQGGGTMMSSYFPLYRSNRSSDAA